MKKPSDALFRLIKSMTKGEKTYFKTFNSSDSSGNSSANYIKLFDAISKLSVYDEKILLNKFRKEAFAKNFVETKQYLKARIMKALRNYSHHKSITFQLKEDLLDIEILMKKGIFDLAKTQLKKALKIAHKYELVHAVFELNRLQFEISRALLDFKSMEVYATEMIAEEETLLKKIGHIQYHWHRYVMLFHNWKKYGPIQAEATAVNLEDYPLDSFNAGYFYYIKELNIGQVSKSANEFYEDAKSNYELFQGYPEQIDLHPLNYMVSTILYIRACAQINSTEEGLLLAEGGVSFLKTIYQKNKVTIDLFAEYILKLNSSQLRLYLHYGSEDLFKKHYLIHKDLTNKYLDFIKPPTAFIHLATIINSEIILEEWVAAEFSYKKIINYKTRGYRNDIESIIRLFGLIIYYEKNDIESLENLVDASYQFIRKKASIPKFAHQFIVLFKYKIINALNKRERLEHLVQFKKESLIFFEEEPEERNILGYFDFIAWMDSQIEGISIYEAYYRRLAFSNI